jgi:hypothetical protein
MLSAHERTCRHGWRPCAECGRHALDAAARGDRERLRALLRDGAATTFRDRQGMTALHHAAARGDARCMRELLEWGASPRAQPLRDLTGSPLHKATWNRDADCVALLLRFGADASEASFFQYGDATGGMVRLIVLPTLLDLLGYRSKFAPRGDVRTVECARALIRAGALRGRCAYMDEWDSALLREVFAAGHRSDCVAAWARADGAAPEPDMALRARAVVRGATERLAALQPEVARRLMALPASAEDAASAAAAPAGFSPAVPELVSWLEALQAAREARERAADASQATFAVASDGRALASGLKAARLACELARLAPLLARRRAREDDLKAAEARLESARAPAEATLAELRATLGNVLGDD